MGVILIASARGSAADWLQNIQANPKVRIRVGKRNFEAVAQPTADPNQIADYLERQMARNPRLFGRILRMEGFAFFTFPRRPYDSGGKTTDDGDSSGVTWLH